MKIRTELQAEIDVEFKDSKKAETYLHGPFKETFFTFKGLKEMAEHLSFVLDGTPESWNSEEARFEKFIEGFGAFTKKGPACNWHLVDDYGLAEMGEVIVSYELELEPSGSYEI